MYRVGRSFVDCFCRPTATAIWGSVSSKIIHTYKIKYIGSEPSYGVKVAARMGEPPVAVEMACCRIIIQSSA